MKVYYREDYVSPTLKPYIPHYQDIMILRDFIYQTNENKALITVENCEYSYMLENTIQEISEDFISLYPHDFTKSSGPSDLKRISSFPIVYVINRRKAMEILGKYDCRLQPINEEIHIPFPPLAYLY